MKKNRKQMKASDSPNRFLFEDIDGEVSNRPSPKVRSVMDFLDAYPEGKFVTTRKLIVLMEVQEGTMRSCQCSVWLEPYKVTVGRRSFWGNPKSVSQYKQCKKTK